MTRLPTPGSDTGKWGEILNEFLSQAHTSDGKLKTDSVSAGQLAPGSVVTPALADGSVTQVKLHSGVQASLVKADTAVQPGDLGDSATKDIGTTPGTVKAGDWKPSAADVIDSSAAGRTMLTAEDAAAQRGALGIHTAAQRVAERPGVKLKGGNITVKPGGGSWGGLWSEWDWSNWIRPQIDRAAALGMNAVRLIGNPGIVFFGASGGWPAISQGTYNARWEQVADYCQTLGLYIYPCLTEKWTFSDGAGGYNFGSSPAIAAVTSSAQALATHSNVFGFDVFQEGSGYAEGLTLSNVLAVYAAIRDVAPGVPLTTSSSSSGFGTAAGFWTDRTSLPYQTWTAASGADFVDLHIYLDSPLVGDLDHHVQVGLPVVIGEYGTTQDVASATQVARFTAVSMLHARPGVLGSFVWALADQAVAASGQAGVWDNTGYSVGASPLSTTAGKRTTLTNIIDRQPTMHTPERTHTPTNLLPARVTRANLLDVWAEGANTARSVVPYGVAMVANSNGNTLLGTSYAGGGSARVALDTWYRVDIEMISSVAGVTIGIRVDWLNDSGVYVTNTSTATGVSATLTPVRLSLIAKTPLSGVSYANIVLSSTGSATGNSHTILSEPPPRMIRLS